MSRPASTLRLPQAGEPLPLPFEDDAPPQAQTPPAPLPRRHSTRHECWLGVHLPELVLESHIDIARRSMAAAVVADSSGQVLIRAVTMAAAEQGVASGMTLAGAMALVPGLRLYTFFPERLSASREVLAERLQRFTPQVVIDGPDALLLEVGASLRLFGGLQNLLTRLTALLEQRGHAAATAVAPTPRAALWLARSRPGTQVTEAGQLDAALRDVPLAMLPWPDDVVRRFAAMGVTDLGDCRRLPRAGIARRFGPAFLLTLDRAYGAAADPRENWRAPTHFESRLELTSDISDKVRLAGAAALLLERLARFARRRQRCVRAMQFGFYALDAPATHRTLRPGVLAQEVGHWQRLLELDLESVEFSAPTILIELIATEFEPLRAQNGRLSFDGQPAAPTRAAATGLLLERLRTRLGRPAVRALRLVADHRPERAMQFVDPQAPTFAHVTGLSPWRELPLATTERLCLARPAWLLPEPCPLPAVFGDDVTVRFCHGPERIEAGWWDGAEIARDYYVAQTHTGAFVWLFRDRHSATARWYLHGLFG